MKVKIQQIQSILGVKSDGIWGPITQRALDDLLSRYISGKASSFADPADVAAFEKCKKNGGSDTYCFKFGDNGMGVWGDKTSQTHTPMVAVPPDDMIAKWGSIDGAKHKNILVTVNGVEVKAKVADRMPWRKNIKNGAVIDLNPATYIKLGLKAPFMVPASWRWA